MPRSTPGNYVPLDVNYARDSAIRRAGPYAELLFIRSLAYAKGAKSGGFVPDYDLEVVAVGLPKVQQSVTKLVEARLWIVEEGGWRIRSWGPWNNAGEAEEAAGRKAAHARWHVQEGKRSDDCDLCRADAIASTTAHAPPDADPPATAVPPDIQGKGREGKGSLIETLDSKSPSVTRANGDDPDDLDGKIIALMAGLRPGRPIDREWARKIRDDITSRITDDIRNLPAYLAKCIRDEPDRYLPASLPPPFELQADLHGPGASDLAQAADKARAALDAQRRANRETRPAEPEPAGGRAS